MYIYICICIPLVYPQQCPCWNRLVTSAVSPRHSHPPTAVAQPPTGRRKTLQWPLLITRDMEAQKNNGARSLFNLVFWWLYYYTPCMTLSPKRIESASVVSLRMIQQAIQVWIHHKSYHQLMTTPHTVDGCETLHHQKDGWKPMNNGINYLSTGAGCLPSTVSSFDCDSTYVWWCASCFW